MGKPKGKKKAAGGQKASAFPTSAVNDGDENWDDILNKAVLDNKANATATESEHSHPKPLADEPIVDDQAAEKIAEKEEMGFEDDDGHDTAPKDAAAAFLAAQGIDSAVVHGGSGAADKKDKKKKKKKKTVAGTPAPSTESKTDEKVSARGKLVTERLRKQREEEERQRLAEEAEARRLAEIEAAEEAERKRIEEEKERKRQKQKDKIKDQRKEGTYLTKAQRQKARLNEQRVEAMKASGMLPPATGVGSGQKPSQHQKKKGKKEKQHYQDKQTEHDVLDHEHDDAREADGKADPHEDETQMNATDEYDSAKNEDQEFNDMNGKMREIDMGTEGVVNERHVDVKEDDEDEEDDDDASDEWDANSADDVIFADLEEKIKTVELKQGDADDDDDDSDEEDLIAAERREKEEERRAAGVEREKRKKEEAVRRALLTEEEENMKRTEQIAAQKKAEGKKRRLEQETANFAARNRDDLRCPIVVIMGHVDTGKTKLLDKIRRTNVQEGEAGGITQQIGATFFEKKTLEQTTSRLNMTEKFIFTIPGMLVIDTPGHESFSNLRSRGSSLCDVAILVVDLMHGLEQQTIESLNMLRSRGTPFVVALNKVDRCYAWVTCPDAPIREALEKQQEGTDSEFRSRAADAKLQLQQLGVNSNIYWEMGEEDWSNSDFIPLVPTSAISGEGVQDLLMLLCQISQKKMWEQLMWCANLQCTVLEVKAIDGLGMTVDVLVVNGYIQEGDKAIFCTLDGPIVAEIRGLLTPPPSREMRIKSEYIHHKKVKGALGVKLIGNNLEKVMAGTPVMVVGPDDDEEDIKAEVMSDLKSLQEKLSTDKKGVMVQASTLGALEALLQFLREETNPPIPVSAIGIGTIHKKDVTKISIMNEKGCSEYATILAFDVPIEREARDHAAEMSVRIFTADVIYHLFDQFTRFMDELAESRRQEAAAIAVFPSILKILPQHVFNTKDPIIIGVEIIEGILKIGTPLCVPALDGLHVGKVTSIECNGKQQDTARKGLSVAVRIVNEHNPTLTYGRQFDSTNSLYSTLTRVSIDALKTNFKDKLESEDWLLVMKLKKVFNII